MDDPQYLSTDPQAGTAAQGLLTPGNIDLQNRPRVRNADGSVSTVRSVSVNMNGKEVLLPTVSDDGRVMSVREAMQQYRRTGRHLGIFRDPDSATAYAQQLHNDQAQRIRQPASDGYLSTDPKAGQAPPRGYLSIDPNAGKPIPRTWGDTAKDVGVGALKGAAHTALDLGQLVHAIPGVGAATDAIGNAAGSVAGKVLSGTASPPVSGDKAFEDARARTAYTNTPQRIGGGLETAAELALPVGEAANAVPRVGRAAETFQSVMAAAKHVPVDVNAPGQVALRINELAQRGGSMPMAVRKFLGYITDPNQPPMTYEVARDFASNISRLSANEYQRLTPVVGREVANLRVTLNQAVADAAKQAGKLDEYRSAMREYAQAMRLRDVFDSVVAGAKKTLPFATGASGGYWLAKKIGNLVGGEP